MLLPKEGADGMLTRHVDNASELLRRISSQTLTASMVLWIWSLEVAPTITIKEWPGGVGSRRASFRA
jgi:hypothetical protein